MERQRGAMMDGVSRGLCLLTIVLGGGFLLFLYQQNQQLIKQVAMLKEDLTAVQGKSADTTELYELAQKFDGDWENLNSFKSRVGQTMETAQTNLDALQREFAQATERLDSDRAELTTLNQGLAALQSSVYAKLQLAEKRMRVGAGDQSNVVYVNNEGLMPAEIRSVEFFPRRDGQFRTTPEHNKAANECLADGKTFVVEFHREDNQSESENKQLHKNYVREFDITSRPAIPGQQTIPVAVLIRNQDHIGWGWEGALEISYANGESLRVPSVRAVFISDEA